ncbi:MAG: DUF2971 domain-containing protein [Pseudomonadota bacterium]
MALRNLDEIFKEHPDNDKVLYHYTGLAGLYGILRSGEIWAFHSQYLNDSEEYNCAIELCKRHIESRIKDKRDQDIKGQLEWMRDLPEEVSKDAYVFVFSLSEADDSLPQWRAYGDSGGCFAIGFDPEELKTVVDKRIEETEYNIRMGRCRYGKLEQNRIAKLIVAQAVQKHIGDGPAGRGDKSSCQVNFAVSLHEFAPIIKHGSFKDEQEWRVIIGPISERNEFVDFRPGKSMLRPYYKLSLKNKNKNDKGLLPIKRIVIGPTPHSKQSRSSVKGFLKKLGYRDSAVEVSETNVPYRDW